MSVLPSDIVVYGSANMPEADGAINGGPVDFSRRVAFYDIAPAGNLDVISSSASDTATKITFYGRDATGVIQNQTLSLNGQTWVTGSQSLERLLYAALSGATANGPVANPGGTAAVATWRWQRTAVYCRPVQSPLTQRFEPHRAGLPITRGRPRPCSSCRRVTEPTSPSDR
jgi:hypothetical protein